MIKLQLFKIVILSIFLHFVLCDRSSKQSENSNLDNSNIKKSSLSKNLKNIFNFKHSDSKTKLKFSSYRTNLYIIYFKKIRRDLH